MVGLPPRFMPAYFYYYSKIKKLGKQLGEILGGTGGESEIGLA
jgi:hypothetical protein